MENREIEALLADFETVWQRVYLPSAETEEQKMPKAVAALQRPEPRSGRMPRWFGVV